MASTRRIDRGERRIVRLELCTVPGGGLVSFHDLAQATPENARAELNKLVADFGGTPQFRIRGWMASGLALAYCLTCGQIIPPEEELSDGYGNSYHPGGCRPPWSPSEQPFIIPHRKPR